MKRTNDLARILLRPDGLVHIALRDGNAARSIAATPENLTALFSDPIIFILEKSATYASTTQQITRDRVALEDISGLTLASVSADKQVVCEFPELFRFVFASSENDKNYKAQINMNSLAFENILSDDKSFLLRYYLEFTNQLSTLSEIKHNISLRDEVQYEIIRETLNAFFRSTADTTPALPAIEEQIAAARQTTMSKKTSTLPPNIVTVAEYATRKGLNINTVRAHVKANRYKSAYKDDQGRWMLDINDELIDWDKRAGRKRSSTDEKHYKRKTTCSAKDVEEAVLRNNHFTAAIAKTIKTPEELEYYLKHSYHEVFWNGRPALIIDINPEFISSDGRSNRDLILANKSPVYINPDGEEVPYHVHHVGQKLQSPFAIIPDHDHNGEMYSYFHADQPDGDLHDTNFHLAKCSFWKTYLEEYDAAGKVFWKIPYLNPKKQKNKQ